MMHYNDWLSLSISLSLSLSLIWMQNIPIDACILDKDSSLLQQACDIHELTSNDAL